MKPPSTAIRRRDMVLFFASGLACAPFSARAGMPQNSIKVATFGAKGDGLADDTAAIQSALDKLSQSGGELRFDKLSYNVGPLVLFNARNVRIAGNGATLVRLFPVSDQSLVNVLEVLGCEGVAIEDLLFDGSNRRFAPAEKNCHNLAIHGSTKVALTNVQSSYSLCDGIYINSWSGTRHGHTASSPVNSGEIMARNFVSTYNFRQGLSIISCDGFSDIDGNYSFTGRAPCGSTAPAAGIDLESNLGAPWIPQRCTFTGTVLDNNVGAGMSIAPSTMGVVLSRVTINGNSGFGIVNQGGKVSLRDVKITNSADARRPSLRPGVLLDGPSSDTVIRNVTVSGSMMGAVSVNNVAHADIDALDITDSEIFGLRVVADKPDHQSSIRLNNIRISRIYTGIPFPDPAYVTIISTNNSPIVATGIKLNGSNLDHSRTAVPKPVDINAAADLKLRQAIELAGFGG